nr:NADH dehydrogenase [ubiquinone] iron-sulfur protein 5-B [Ipomoea batatas]
MWAYGYYPDRLNPLGPFTISLTLLGRHCWCCSCCDHTFFGEEFQKKRMASGWGITGNKGRCYDFWMDFSECMSGCREPKDCALLREDYLECLHHSKEVLPLLTHFMLLILSFRFISIQIWIPAFDLILFLLRMFISSWTQISPGDVGF